MDANDRAWAAGMLSSTGTMFTASSWGKTYVTLTVTSKIHHEAVERFASIAGGNVMESSRKNGQLKFSMSGDKLHEFLRELWPELTRERKAEYLTLRRTNV